MTSPTLAVVGCGLIGESWIALGLSRGWKVRAWDLDADVRESLAARVRQPLNHLAQLGFSKSGAADLVIGNTLEEAVVDCDLIQENAPEKVDVKRALYTSIEEAVAPDAIIASSTSALTWSDLSPGLRLKQRFITAHPFNPPHLIPLVELFGIDQDVLSRARALYGALGRTPVVLRKDAVGHIANRLASALWREAVNIVAEGIADVEDVDLALREGPGLRWSVVGAHMAYHLGGGPGGISNYLTHLGPSQVQRWASLGQPELTPELCARLVAGVEREAGGRSIRDLEEGRDRQLLAILDARNKAKDADP